MKFEDRFSKAVERGQHLGERRAAEAAQRALNEEELRRLHSQYRLEISERIEACLQQLPRHFPGFRIEPIYGDKGWGAAAVRDDLIVESGRRVEYFSRLELTIRPFSPLGVLDLAAKGTVRNKEIFNRNHFEKLADADLDGFASRIENWTLEYAELYANRTQ